MAAVITHDIFGDVRLPRFDRESILRVSTCSHHLPYSLCCSLHRAPRASVDLGGFGCLPGVVESFVVLSGILAPGGTEHFLPHAPLAKCDLLPPPPLELRGGKIAERRVSPMRVVGRGRPRTITPCAVLPPQNPAGGFSAPGSPEQHSRRSRLRPSDAESSETATRTTSGS